ncbi:MAG TPA: hypothetical protein VNS32_06140 [Flavisolibacter sp.]|nr:hypothetical protein [Flavisolibacter sp.]
MKKLFFIFLIMLSGRLNAQVIDTLQYIKIVDRLVSQIDSERELNEFISEGQVINKRSGKALNDGFAHYFYHDKNTNALLKVIDNPIKRVAFTTTFYLSNDSLIFIKAESRNRKDNKTAYYYISNNRQIKLRDMSMN